MIKKIFLMFRVNIAIINFGLLITMLYLNTQKPFEERIVYKDKIKVVKTKVGDSLNKENLLEYILERRIKYPIIVFKQAMLETGWLKCNNCSRRFNNLFGFLTKKGYLSFNHWKKSVDYYKWWQDKLYKGGDYYVFIKRIGYAEDPEYIIKLKVMDISNVASCPKIKQTN